MKNSLPLLVVICCLANFSKGMLFNGFQIRDLYTNDNTFITDANEWIATHLRNGISYSTCDGTSLVGGYDVLGKAYVAVSAEGEYFRRVYDNLPDHNIIYFSISLWLIDSWDSSPPDYFQIQFDSVLAEGWSFGSGNFTQDFCGNSLWPDLKNMTIFGQVSHSGSSLALRMITQLDNYAIDESLGFRDINLIFAKSTETNVNELCGLSSIPLPSNQCSCPYGEYFDDIDTLDCQLCDTSCRSCFGSTAQECYECQVGFSFDGTECIKCDESCAVCSGPRANQCIDCPAGMSLVDDGGCISSCLITSIAGTVLVCDQPCETDQFYFYENQTCSNECNFPYIINPFLTNPQACTNPCPGGYIYWDGTCHSHCPFPLEVTKFDYEVAICDFSCGFDELMYWDGSCGTDCNGTLIISIYKDRVFCQHPCEIETDYIYWNGSCGSDCPSPYLNSSDGKANYCDLPCEEDQKYWNGSVCLESCNPPLIAREEDGINYCEFPCSSSSDYLYWNGSCIDSCPLPYKASSSESSVQLCWYLCEQDSQYYYPVNGECLPSCDAPYAPEVQIVDDENWYVACVNTSKIVIKNEDESDEGSESTGPFYYPITAVRIASEKVAGVFIALDTGLSLLSDSHLMIMILIIKILNYIKYMDIRVPPQLVQEFKTYDHNHFYLNFGPAMSESMQEGFTDGGLPMVFERAGLHSRFLVNFFKSITSFLIMLGLMIMIAILQRVFRRKNRYILMKIILRRLETYFKWNLIVLLVICNIDEIIMYSILEWKTINIGSAQDFFSLIASLGMFVLAGVVIIAPFYLLNKIYNTRFKVLSNLTNEPYFELLKKIEGFQVLWKDFKDSSGSQKAFMSIYILRIALMYLIVASLYKHPLTQMILIFSMSLGMLIFMNIVKPFMKNLDFIQSVMYEICMLLSIGSTLILAVLDRTHTRADQLWLFLGNCIQFCHILVTLTSVVIFMAKFYREVQSVKEFYKTLPKSITRQEFWILVLQENDPITHELKRNQRTSTRLDITDFEKEIQRKKLASYNISFTYSPDGPLSQSASVDETQPMNLSPQKKLRIRRSLFNIRKQSSDSESSPGKTASTLDEEKSPYFFGSIENLKLSSKSSSQNEIKKNPSDPPPEEENEEVAKKNNNPEVVQEEKSESDTVREKNMIWKGLETIKEVDSMEVSRMKSGEQTGRLANMLQETLRGDLGLLNILNKKLSSETRQKTEETVIVKEKEDSVKKKLTSKIEIGAQDSLFV